MLSYACVCVLLEFVQLCVVDGAALSIAKHPIKTLANGDGDSFTTLSCSVICTQRVHCVLCPFLSGIDFKTPEEFFKGHKPAAFKWSSPDPDSWIKQAANKSPCPQPIACKVMIGSFTLTYSVTRDCLSVSPTARIFLRVSQTISLSERSLFAYLPSLLFLVLFYQ